jgi:hypothetical protein
VFEEERDMDRASEVRDLVRQLTGDLAAANQVKADFFHRNGIREAVIAVTEPVLTKKQQEVVASLAEHGITVESVLRLRKAD